MAVGCSRASTPTAPTSSFAAAPATAPTPSPAAENVTLTGRVTEAPPTTTMGLWDAVVTLDDGTNSWRSAKTVGGVGRGAYTISGLKPGQYRATVGADGYVTTTQHIVINADTAFDFRLLPVATTKTLNVSGEIKSTDGSCSDGTAMRPCRIIAIPIHNAGPIDATLTWQAAGPVALNLTLFEGNQSTPMAQSAAAGTNQRISVSLSGGALYELRITYASGTAVSSYSLSVIYPN